MSNENDDERQQRHQEELSQAMRHDRTIRYLSLIWLLIVGCLLGYGMAACLGELVFGGEHAGAAP